VTSTPNIPSGTSEEKEKIGRLSLNKEGERAPAKFLIFGRPEPRERRARRRIPTIGKRAGFSSMEGKLVLTFEPPPRVTVTAAGGGKKKKEEGTDSPL